LNNACTVGDAVVTESFLVSSVLNAIPATAGAVNSTYLASSLMLTTPTLTSPTLTTPNIDSAQFATVSGTAPLYAARAWVNFNGTGTVAIRASGNVSSITDNGTGDYTVNFTTAMPDANYSVGGTSSRLNAGDTGILSPIALSAGSVQVQTGLRTVGSYDNSINSVAIFR
jgi:hypothetical protein